MHTMIAAPLVVPATLDSLVPIRQFVRLAADNAALDSRRTYRLCLAVDEIAINSIQHGYQEAGLDGTVNVSAYLDETALTITLEDQGLPFDPRTFPPPDNLNCPLEERRAGGLGVYLALQSVDQFDYVYQDKKNRYRFLMNRAVESQ